MNKLLLMFNRLAEQPPRALRILYPLLFLLMALGVAHRRGWAVGIVAVIVYGGMGLAFGLAPQRVVAWSRRHAGMDGAMLGPLLFLGLAYLTALDIWLCAGLGAGGAVAGAALGRRKQRRLRTADRG